VTQRPEDSDFRSESSSSRQQSREVTLTEAHVNESESVEDKARVNEAIKVISMEDPQTKPQEKKKLKTFKNHKTSVSKEQTLAIVKDIIA